MAELIIQTAEPGRISFNFEELKTELSAKVESYKTMAYTDETMKDARNDRASLNRLAKALNDERIKREKEFMVPFNEFKAQIKELISIIEEASENIDAQIKEYEDRKKKEKLETIEKIWDEVIEHPEWLQCSDIFSTRWLNASVSMETVKKEIAEKLEKINTELGILQDLPEYSFEGIEYYKRSLDLGQAIAETKRLGEIQRKKEAEAEAQKILADKVKGQGQATAEEVKAYEEAPEPVKMWWVNIRAKVSVAQSKELTAWFNDHNIEFEAKTEGRA